jgi:hypothetical protein
MCLAEDEFENLKELKLILEPLFIFTQLIQADDVSISRILPGLFTILTILNDKLTDTVVYDELISNLISNIKNRFKYVFENDLFIFASCLDPNFALHWMKPHDKSAVKRKLKAYLSANVIFSKTSAQPLWFSAPSRDSLDSEDDTVQKEINRYLSLAKSHMDDHLKEYPLDPNEKDKTAPPACALKFWNKNSTPLLLMAAKARLLFAIPATSAFCERFFFEDGFHNAATS